MGVVVSVVVQVLGSLIILSAFILAQSSKLDQASRAYLSINALGAATLGIDAIVERQWGFVLLESVWALTSCIGLIRSARGISGSSSAPDVS
jgi:hypothetical protein